MISTSDFSAENNGTMCFILQTRRPKSSLVRFEIQLVQLPLCSLVSWKAVQVHIASGQRPDVPSVIRLGNRQPGPLRSTNSAHHWSWRSSGTRTCRELEKGTCDSHASFNASGEGENEGNTQSSWKVRRWPKTTISDGARPKISRNGAGWCRYISTGTGKKMKK